VTGTATSCNLEDTCKKGVRCMLSKRITTGRKHR
jgi:hypothetical protein